MTIPGTIGIPHGSIQIGHEVVARDLKLAVDKDEAGYCFACGPNTESVRDILMWRSHLKVSPLSLRRMIDPQTRKKFTNWISRSLGATNYIPTAKKLRDIRLAEIRAMEADAAKGEVLGDRFSLERATAWAETLSVQKSEGGPDDHEPDVVDLIK